MAANARIDVIRIVGCAGRSVCGGVRFVAVDTAHFCGTESGMKIEPFARIAFAGAVRILMRASGMTLRTDAVDRQGVRCITGKTEVFVERRNLRVFTGGQESNLLFFDGVLATTKMTAFATDAQRDKIVIGVELSIQLAEVFAGRTDRIETIRKGSAQRLDCAGNSGGWKTDKFRVIDPINVRQRIVAIHAL